MNFSSAFEKFLIFGFVCVSLATADSERDCGEPSCPAECANDPCDCDEVEMCMESACRPNGCDQCQSSYFKKDYNYHCTQCQEIFGDDCVHCTDFLGCQQCSSGTRTYDTECSLFYCREDTPECSGSESSESNEYTLSPTEEPTEEPTEMDYELVTTDKFGPCGTGISSNGDDINGYFNVDSVSNTDYDYLVGMYTYSGEDMEDGSPIYSKNDEMSSYHDGEGTGNFILEYTSGDGSTTIYFMLDVDTLSETAGDNTWSINGGGEEGDVDIRITVYDCDGNMLTVYEDSCSADCIDVSNFSIDTTTMLGSFLANDLVAAGGAQAFNGRYCFDSDCDYEYELNFNRNNYYDDDDDDSDNVITGCYEREAETDDIYSAGLGINGENGNITFIWDWEGIHYFAEYSIMFDDGDLACDQVIDQFFTNGDMNGGTWVFTSDHFDDINNYGNNVNVIPQFDFDDCIGQDYYCGIGSSGLKCFNINWFMYSFVAICAVLYR